MTTWEGRGGGHRPPDPAPVYTPRSAPAPQSPARLRHASTFVSEAALLPPVPAGPSALKPSCLPRPARRGLQTICVANQSLGDIYTPRRTLAPAAAAAAASVSATPLPAASAGWDFYAAAPPSPAGLRDVSEAALPPPGAAGTSALNLAPVCLQRRARRGLQTICVANASLDDVNSHVYGAKGAEIKCKCLDVLASVPHSSGNLITEDHGQMLTALLSQLGSNQASVRKKSISCIASLAPCLSDDLLGKATLQVIQLLKNRGAKSEITRTHIQMIGSLSCSMGYRFGSHLAETVPLLISYCTNASENDEELREYSLQALESFMLRCPRDISPYCEGILNLALEYVSYDPKFTDSMDEDTDEEGREEDDDDESANEYTDDEDASWKVRRASAKCLSAIIVSHPEMLSKMYLEACPKLIERFREREENVKMDIFNTFIELLRQTGNVMKGQDNIDESSPRWLLKQEVPKVVKSINRQLREKSIKTKVGAFSALKELVVVLPDCPADHFGSLVPGIEKALNDKSSTSNLKIEALVFTRLVMASHSPSVFHPYIKALSAPILSAMGDRYYKVTAEALRVCGELVRVLRPNLETSYNQDFRPYIGPIYNAILGRLANQDQDQEVRECAISCISLVVSTFGDGLQRELPACLPILVDRMGNEITRLTAVKAFSVIANSPLRIDLSCVLDHVVSELTDFLRKANRALRQATLGTLNSLVVTYGGQIGSSSYETIIAELSTRISDMELHMTALALELCCTIMVDRKSIKNVGLAVKNKVLPRALVLIRSALLQGQALQDLQRFFALLVQSANASFDALLISLISAVKPSQSGSLAKQALSSIAKCVAVLCLAAGDQNCASTIEMLKGILKDDSTTNSAKQYMALLCLRKIGRRKDLSNHVQIENIVIESFQSPLEEIKSAASYALGNIAVGNLSKYLPFILDQIDNQQKKQYLLLHSLKEVIVRKSVDHTGQSELQDSNIKKILALLFNHCESEEEGVRNVVAECLGKIALIEPRKLVPALKVRTFSPAANTRTTVAIAIKYSIVERPEKIDEIMYSEISTFLILIKDSDRHVRRAAVLALSTAAHNKPNLIKGLLPELLPLLYNQTVIKQELIRTVDLGPFKHVVDDGLELRKAAFECVDTLLDSCLDQVNPSSFIVPFLLSGLGDHYDVKMPCHLILSKLADKCPSAVLAVLDSIVEPIEKTVSHKPKGDAVMQEVDRNEDMIRCALRAISSLSRISGSDHSIRFKNLMNKVVLSEKTGGEKSSQELDNNICHQLVSTVSAHVLPPPMVNVFFCGFRMRLPAIGATMLDLVQSALLKHKIKIRLQDFYLLLNSKITDGSLLVNSIPNINESTIIVCPRLRGGVSITLPLVYVPLDVIINNNRDKLFSHVEIPASMRSATLPSVATFLSDLPRFLIHQVFQLVCCEGHLQGDCYRGRFNLSKILVSSCGHVRFTDDVEKKPYTTKGGQADYERLFFLVMVFVDFSAQRYPAHIASLLWVLRNVPEALRRKTEFIAYLVNHPALLMFAEKQMLYRLIDSFVFMLMTTTFRDPIQQAEVDEFKTWVQTTVNIPWEKGLECIPDFDQTYKRGTVTPPGALKPVSVYQRGIDQCFHLSRNFVTHNFLVGLGLAEAAVSWLFENVLPNVLYNLGRCLSGRNGKTFISLVSNPRADRTIVTPFWKNDYEDGAN